MPNDKNGFSHILVLLLVSIFIIVGLFYYLQGQSLSLFGDTEGVSHTDSYKNCTISGQTASKKLSSGRDSYQKGSAVDSVGNQYIGRLVNKNPPVFEIYDYKVWPDSPLPRVIYTNKLNEDLEEKFEALSYGDMVSFKDYSYMTYGAELGMGSAILEIDTFSPSSEYYHEDLSNFPNMNRSGVLIKYTKQAPSGELTIFNDGNLYYWDSTGAKIPSHLSQEELDSLLKLFSSTNYNSLKSDYSFYQPSIMLICTRFQNVLLSGNESELDPVIESLDNIIDSLDTTLSYTLTYEFKEPIAILDWPFSDIPPETIMVLQEEALDYYRKNDQIKIDSPVYKKFPDSGLRQTKGFTNQTIPTTYYRYNEKIYFVSGGGRCLKDPCKEGTLYTLSIEEITKPNNTLKAVNLWPIPGLDISENKEILVSNEIAASYKSMFDLIGSGHVNSNFIDNSNLYRGVRVLKMDEVVDQESTKSYLLYVKGKHELRDWNGQRSISEFSSSFHYEDDASLKELRSYYPELIDNILSSSGLLFFREGEKIYEFSGSKGLGGNYIFIRLLSQSTDGFTGYTMWKSPEIDLGNVTFEGLRISEGVVRDNNIKLSYRQDRYFIDGDYLYFLDLSNEPIK